MTQSYTNQKDSSFKSYLSKTYFAIAGGLLISAVFAFLACEIVPLLFYTVPGFASLLMLIMPFAEIGVAIYFSSRLFAMNKKTAWTCYIAYSALTGFSLYSIFLYYDLGSLTLALVATIVMFVCMALIGRTSKFNFMSLYGLLIPALFAGIIVTLLNSLIFHSPFVDLAIAYVGIIIFLVITAADVQKLEAFYNQSSYDNELSEKLMVMGAFQLYLDFINIFLRILQFLGRRRDN